MPYVLCGMCWNCLLYTSVLVIADGAAFGPQMNDIYRLMQEDSTKFSLYLPESLEWLLLKADLLGQPDILEILEHPADFIESGEFFSWERFFTNLLEQRTKDISYMRYDKAKLPEFYLQDFKNVRLSEQIRFQKQPFQGFRQVQAELCRCV